MRGEIICLILGMGLVTFVPRFLPMAFLARWKIPEKVKIGLEYMPITILSALVFPVFFFDGRGTFEIQPQSLLAALPVFAFA